MAGSGLMTSVETVMVEPSEFYVVYFDVGSFYTTRAEAERVVSVARRWRLIRPRVTAFTTVYGDRCALLTAGFRGAWSSTSESRQLETIHEDELERERRAVLPWRAD